MRKFLKRSLDTELLRHLPTSAFVPSRHEDLYYSILSGLDIGSLPVAKQLLALRIAWTFCRLRDVMDRRYLFGESLDLTEKSGGRVNCIGDAAQKKKEYELLPQLDKQLISLIAALDNNKTNAKQKENGRSIADILNDISSVETNGSGQATEPETA